MTFWKRFWIGGGGALLPLLITLLAVDIAGLVDNPGQVTLGIAVGTTIRYVVLFLLGGLVAGLNADETKPIKLVQLGIGAPAIIASLINAQVPGPVKKAEIELNWIGSAVAAEVPKSAMLGAPLVQIQGFFGDVISGATSSIPKAVQRDTQRRDESGWYVIIGSFKSKEDAQRKADQVNAKFSGKYNAQVGDIYKSNTSYPVYIGADISKSEAMKLEETAQADRVSDDIMLWRTREK